VPGPDFSSMNETDVREVIVRPLLERLGYRHGSDATIRTEVPLRYDKAFLGRKKPTKDPPLRGKPDYVCDAIPFGRWVIEVKAPDQELTTDVREQTHTYAAHPEIAAAYFLLTNGRRFELYRTSRLDGPVLAWSFDDLEEKFLTVLNLVSPAALRSLAGLVKPDPGKPLGVGLASSMRIVGGSVTYEEHTSSVPFPMVTSAIEGLSLPITGDSVGRTSDGKIHASVKVASAFAMMQGLSALGLDEYDFFSASEYVSSDVDQPTIFQNFIEHSIPLGAPLGLPGGQAVPSPFDYRMKAFTEAVGFVEDGRFKGTMRLDYVLSITGLNPALRPFIEAQFGPFPESCEIRGAGRFDLELISGI
jgi:hypothetical protein